MISLEYSVPAGSDRCIRGLRENVWCLSGGADSPNRRGIARCRDLHHWWSEGGTVVAGCKTRRRSGTPLRGQLAMIAHDWRMAGCWPTRMRASGSNARMRRPDRVRPRPRKQGLGGAIRAGAGRFAKQPDARPRPALCLRRVAAGGEKHGRNCRECQLFWKHAKPSSCCGTRQTPSARFGSKNVYHSMTGIAPY